MQDFERELFQREVERLKNDYLRCPEDSLKNYIQIEIKLLKEIIRK
ncbi:hypothetical protein [Terribacillus sp. JSM ZJ617]